VVAGTVMGILRCCGQGCCEKRGDGQGMQGLHRMSSQDLPAGAAEFRRQD
jgi:hypothetical protein